ncbi:MAG: uroporphyrinogen-III C-methyltransferase [Thermoactinomyces sp.]
MTGTVYLVGAGPGDPGLITVNGLNAIAKADVIIYDRLANPQLLKHAKKDAELVYVGKMPDRSGLKQDDINRLLVEKAKKGLVVVRLKGGDPFVFGRGGEEAECCAEEGIPFEVVPGITSAVAVPAYAGIPVTHRDFNASFSVVTGREQPQKNGSAVSWEALASTDETLVILMGIKNLSNIVEQLIKFGRDVQTPVALIRWGTRIEQETVTGTLGNIVRKAEESGFRSPGVIVVGEVVRLRDKLTWFEKKKLFGKRILVTRARSQSRELSEKIEALGGEALEFPVIRIVPPKRQELFDQALRRLDEFDWVIFTSVNGVKHFFGRLLELGIDIRRMAKARIAAIGPKTAEVLKEKGLLVEVLPNEYKAEALVESLRSCVKKGERILLPRANIARKILADELEKIGCIVSDVDAYDTVLETADAEAIAKKLEDRQIHVLTFTSSSTVRNFVKVLRTAREDFLSLLQGVSVVCIGPITAQTAEECGLKVDRVAETYTIDGLVEALKQLP